MFLLKFPGKTIYLSASDQGESDIHYAVEQCGPFQCAESLEQAEAILNADRSRKFHLDPHVRTLDNDRPGLFRTHIILPPLELPPITEPVPAVASVVLVSTQNIDQSVESALNRLAAFPVERLLVCPYSSNDESALRLLNAGAVQSVVFSDKDNAEDKIVAAIRALQHRRDQSQLQLVVQLLGHGPTAFLKDDSAMALILDAANRNDATELRLALEPPGVLILAPPSPPEFLMICDENYLQGLKEICEEDTSSKPSSFSETSPYLPLADAARTMRRIASGSSWFYTSLPYPDNFGL